MACRSTLNREVVAFVQSQIETLADKAKEDRKGAALWAVRCALDGVVDG
jgi:putative aminopeptidase FrvX